MVIVFCYKGNIDKNILRDDVIERYNAITKNSVDVCLFYDNGVPYLSGDKEISITHTNISKDERIELIAIGDSKIGIDIEREDRCIKYDIARRFFTQDEIQYINDDNTRFLEIWQKKEALGKSHKIGIYKDSVVGVDGFRHYDLYDGYSTILYSHEKDVVFLAI